MNQRMYNKKWTNTRWDCKHFLCSIVESCKDVHVYSFNSIILVYRGVQEDCLIQLKVC